MSDDTPFPITVAGEVVTHSDHSSSGTPGPTELFRDAKSLKIRHRHQLRSLKQDVKELGSNTVSELSTYDLSLDASRVKVLQQDYSSNMDIVLKLADFLKDDEVESLVEDMEDDLRELGKLRHRVNQVACLQTMYQTTLQMKGLTTRLSAAKNLLRPICQEDVRTLRCDLAKVRPMVIVFSCTRLQALFDEVDS